jgi:hypothetical protein
MLAAHLERVRLGWKQPHPPGALVPLSNTVNQPHCSFIFLSVLPEWLPFHPHRWWIHCRMVYLPMSYLYGIRFQAKEADLILSLREVWLYDCSRDLR